MDHPSRPDHPVMEIDRLVAIDVHVHLEHTGELTAADDHAKKYFGAGASRDLVAKLERFIL